LCGLHYKQTGPDLAFRRVGRRTTKAELDALATAAERFETAIAGLHKDAIDALANSPTYLGGPWTRRNLSAVMRDTVRAARAADVSRIKLNPNRQGTAAVRHADRVTALLMHSYRELVGRPPTIKTVDGKAGGGFLDFVRDVLTALGNPSSPEAAARRALTKEKMGSSPDP
jgi:hypothetical protein